MVQHMQMQYSFLSFCLSSPTIKERASSCSAASWSTASHLHSLSAGLVSHSRLIWPQNKVDESSESEPRQLSCGFKTEAIS